MPSAERLASGLVLPSNETSRGHELSLYPPTNIEIERRFLLAEVPTEFLEFPFREYLQGYTPRGTRYRRSTDPTNGEVEFTHVRKVGSGLVKREDGKGVIDFARFNGAWPKTAGRRLDKTRIFIPYINGSEIHIDFFGGKYQPNLAGLIIGEVEFPSVNHALGFEPPEWFLNGGRVIELTGIRRVSSRRLATYGLPGNKFFKNLR